MAMFSDQTHHCHDQHCHFHPSGDPTPSTEDVQMTRTIRGAGKLLDVEVLDHVVIGQQRFVSLKERGLGFG